MRSSSRLWAAVPAALLALSSCSNDPEPIIEPSPAPTTSSSPSPSASPAPSEPESAKAFIRRWQDEAFAMQLSGDTSEYRAMTRNCESCDNLADSVDEIYDAGGSIRTRLGVVSDLQKVGESGSVEVFEYRFRSFPGTVIRSRGDEPETLTGGTRPYQVNVASTRTGLAITSATGLAE